MLLNPLSSWFVRPTPVQCCLHMFCFADDRAAMVAIPPIVLADLALTADYRVRPLLDVPVTVLMGEQDSQVEQEFFGDQDTEISARSWIYGFDKDHFLVYSHRQAALDCIKNNLVEIQ